MNFGIIVRNRKKNQKVCDSPRLFYEHKIQHRLRDASFKIPKKEIFTNIEKKKNTNHNTFLKPKNMITNFNNSKIDQKTDK